MAAAYKSVNRTLRHDVASRPLLQRYKVGRLVMPLSQFVV